MKKFLLLSSFLILALTLSGCNLEQNGSTAVRQPARQASPSVLPSARPTGLAALTPSPGQPGATPAEKTLPAATAQAATASAYPSDPIAVVQAFVEAYPDQTAAMSRCLSTAMRAALPKGGPGELLKVQGDVNGFSVLSGSAVPNPPQAVVVAALEAGGARVERTFNLIQEQGLWVINGIK